MDSAQLRPSLWKYLATRAPRSGFADSAHDRLREAQQAPPRAEAIVPMNHLLVGGEAPRCLDAADADDSGTLNITDSIYALSFLFLGGLPPAAPFPDCGIDPILDGLDCASYPGCP